MKIYALSGYPGAGKTTRRKTDPRLKNLPQFDVKDEYDRHPGILSTDAFANVLQRVIECLRKGQDVVIEATLFQEHWQRVWLEALAGVFNAELEYIALIEDPLVCKNRIKKQYAEELKTNLSVEKRTALDRYYQSRFRILDRFTE